MLGLAEGKILTVAQKSENAYGVKAAKRISTVNNHMAGLNGANAFYEQAQLYDLAIGRASVTDLNRIGTFLNHRQNPTLSAMGFDNMPVQQLNILPHFVNLVHGKLMKNSYDIGVQAIDPMAIDKREQVRQTLMAYARLKDDMKGMGVVFDTIKQQTGLTDLPDVEEDVEMLMQTCYKHGDEVKAELKLKEIFNYNNWIEIEAKIKMDWLVLGKGLVRTFRDSYGRERVEFVPLYKFVGSYCETEDFENLSYGGHLDLITIDQFRKEVGDEMPEEEVIRLFNSHKANLVFGNVRFYDAEDRMLVFRFQFLEQDNDVTIQSEDNLGNIYVDRPDSGFMENGNKDAIINANTITSKYGGTFIIGSDTVYNYKLIHQGVDIKTDYFVYAPQARNGKGTSFVAQAREPIEMLWIAWTNYKEIFGKGYSGTAILDYNLLMKTIEGKGGQKLDWQDKLDLFMIQKLVIQHGARDAHDPNVGRAITIEESGLAAKDFIDAINVCKMLVRDICGVNELSDGSTPAPGTLNGVTEMANAATDTGLSHYNRAYNSVYRRTAISLLNYWKSDTANEVWERDFLVGLEAATTPQQWQEYNAYINRMVTPDLAQGGLTAADALELSYPNIKNYKEGIMIAKNRIRRNRQQAQMELQQRDAQQQQSAAQQQAQAAQAAQAALLLKSKLAKEELTLEYELKGKLQDKVNQGIVLGADARGVHQQLTAKQQGADSIVKTITMNNSDQAIQEMKNQMESFKTMMEEKMHGLEMEIKKEESKEAATT